MSRENPDTRTRILDAAWRLLENDPGTRVKMSDIAAAAGISRQAVYLHFPKRSDLLVETTRHVDRVKNVDERLAASRAAARGVDRLDAFIEAWGNYIPEIYGVARALIAMQDEDEAAAQAWNGRMQAVRHGCAAAVNALAQDGVLAPALSPERATDILWTLLSVGNWEQLTRDCSWPQERYVETMQIIARRSLVAES